MKKFLIISMAFIALPSFAQNEYQLTEKAFSYTFNFSQQAEINVGGNSVNKVGRIINFDFDLTGKSSAEQLEGEVLLKNIEAEQTLPNGKQKIDTRNLIKPLSFTAPKVGGAIRVTGKLPGVALGQAYGGVLSLDYLFSYVFIALPAQKMKQGTKWQSSMTRTQLEATGKMSPELNFEHEVTGKERINGNLCFKIETNMTSSIKTEVKLMQHEEKFEYDGGSKATIVWYYDAKNQRISKLTAEENSEGTMGAATIIQETTFELWLIK